MSAESVPALLEVVVALAASPTLAEVLAPAPPPAQANELNPAARSAPSSKCCHPEEIGQAVNVCYDGVVQ